MTFQIKIPQIHTYPYVLQAQKFFGSFTFELSSTCVEVLLYSYASDGHIEDPGHNFTETLWYVGWRISEMSTGLAHCILSSTV